MKKILLTSVILALSLSATANAAVLTFDDISNTTAYEGIANGYGGLNWNMQVINKDYHPGSGYDLGTVSGNYTAWHYQPANVSITSGTFDFTGAYFASAWNSTMGIVLEGWSAGSQLFSDTINVVNTGPTWFGANYLGIDELRITSLGDQFVMDNFTYNESVSEVPVPAAVWLMGSGLLGLMGFSRKNKKLAS